MQPYLFDRTFDTSSSEFQIYNKLIAKLKHRFSTYGYKQVRTSTFEQYDLYNSVSGTVNRDDMVKVVDNSGKVLVLRPDVTIPITRMTALASESSTDESRLFYILNVFRQYKDADENKERLQAGIEHFGSNTPESDAEVIALAVHTLKDLGFTNFKLEVGHAGFFKEIINQMDLTINEKNQLQTLIQSKNLAEIGPFLRKLNVRQDLANAIEAIPLLYGDPADVLKRVQKVAMNEQMKQKLESLQHLYTVLRAYDVTDSIVFDLGLINNMNYYTGVIFQGYVASYGKPVIMGGRYDHLAEQFGAPLPAIGFACEVDYLLDALKQQSLLSDMEPAIDIALFYENEKQQEALINANRLRDAGFSVVTYKNNNQPAAAEKIMCSASFAKAENRFCHKQKEMRFSDYDTLVSLLQNAIGDE